MSRPASCRKGQRTPHLVSWPLPLLSQIIPPSHPPIPARQLCPSAVTTWSDLPHLGYSEQRLGAHIEPGPVATEPLRPMFHSNSRPRPHSLASSCTWKAPGGPWSGVAVGFSPRGPGSTRVRVPEAFDLFQRSPSSSAPLPDPSLSFAFLPMCCLQPPPTHQDPFPAQVMLAGVGSVHFNATLSDGTDSCSPSYVQL